MGTFPPLPTGMSPAQFRTDFPEFNNVVLFPDSSINYWLNIANIKLNATVSGPRWGRLLFLGMELFTAHNIVLEALAQRGSSNSAGIPGISKGAISAASGGDVSVNYDTQGSMEKDAGHWNLTIYGTRFIREARQTGMGPVQIGVTAGSNTDLSDSAGGWSGPPTLPGQLG